MELSWLSPDGLVASFGVHSDHGATHTKISALYTGLHRVQINGGVRRVQNTHETNAQKSVLKKPVQVFICTPGSWGKYHSSGISSKESCSGMHYTWVVLERKGVPFIHVMEFLLATDLTVHIAHSISCWSMLSQCPRLNRVELRNLLWATSSLFVPFYFISVARSWDE